MLNPSKAVTFYTFFVILLNESLRRMVCVLNYNSLNTALSLDNKTYYLLEKIVNYRIRKVVLNSMML